MAKDPFDIKGFWIPQPAQPSVLDARYPWLKRPGTSTTTPTAPPLTRVNGKIVPAKKKVDGANEAEYHVNRYLDFTLNGEFDRARNVAKYVWDTYRQPLAIDDASLTEIRRTGGKAFSNPLTMHQGPFIRQELEREKAVYRLPDLPDKLEDPDRYWNEVVYRIQAMGKAAKEGKTAEAIHLRDNLVSQGIPADADPKTWEAWVAQTEAEQEQPRKTFIDRRNQEAPNVLQWTLDHTPYGAFTRYAANVGNEIYKSLAPKDQQKVDQRQIDKALKIKGSDNTGYIEAQIQQQVSNRKTMPAKSFLQKVGQVASHVGIAQEPTIEEKRDATIALLDTMKKQGKINDDQYETILHDTFVRLGHEMEAQEADRYKWGNTFIPGAIERATKFVPAIGDIALDAVGAPPFNLTERHQRFFQTTGDPLNRELGELTGMLVPYSGVGKISGALGKLANLGSLGESAMSGVGVNALMQTEAAAENNEGLAGLWNRLQVSTPFAAAAGLAHLPIKTDGSLPAKIVSKGIQVTAPAAGYATANTAADPNTSWTENFMGMLPWTLYGGLKGEGRPAERPSAPPSAESLRRALESPQGAPARPPLPQGVAGMPVTEEMVKVSVNEQPQRASEKPIRFAVGKELTKEQKREVLKTIGDVYKDAKLEKTELKGEDQNGDPRYGYPYSPEHFVTSDITGAKIRHYITLPDGRVAHPTEIFPNITQADINKAFYEQEHQERVEAYNTQQKDSRIFNLSDFPDRQGLNAAVNARYRQTGRKSDTSIFARNADGTQYTRVDGTDPADMKYYADKGFVNIDGESLINAEQTSPLPAARPEMAVEAPVSAKSSVEESPNAAPLTPETPSSAPISGKEATVGELAIGDRVRLQNGKTATVVNPREGQPNVIVQVDGSARQSSYLNEKIVEVLPKEPTAEQIPTTVPSGENFTETPAPSAPLRAQVGETASIYRGQPRPGVQQIENTNLLDNILIGKGVFFTTDKGIASTYGKHLIEAETPTAERVLDLDNATPEQLRALGIDDHTITVYRDTVKAGGASLIDAENILIEELHEKFLPADKSYNEVFHSEHAEDLIPIRDKVIALLREQGYDWLRHQGGLRTEGKAHDVYIALSNDAIEIRRGETATPVTEKKAEPEGIVLQSTIFPGAKEFVGQDVVPAFEKSIAEVGGIVDGIRKLFSPASRSQEAAKTTRTLRSESAQIARDTEIITKDLRQFSKEFDKLPDAGRLDFIDKMENGKSQSSPGLTRVAEELRKAIDERRDAIIALGTGKLDHFIEHYFPHIWEQKTKGNIWQRMFGRRPLEGSKSFLKHRSIPTTKEGMSWRIYNKDGNIIRLLEHEADAKAAIERLGKDYSLGEPLTPVTTNPIELSLLKIREMDRYLMGQKVIVDLKDNKILKFVRGNRPLPEGYAKIDDAFATVYGPRTKDGSATIRGRYVAPEPVATVLNNFLSPGLRGKPGFEAFRTAGALMNQAQLGLSAFHAMFTTLDAITSKFSLGVRQLSIKGQRLEGLKNIGLGISPYAALQNVLRGKKFLREYYKPGSTDAEMQRIVEQAVEGGYRAKMDSFYHSNAWESFTKAFKAGNYPGAALRMPFATIDVLARPIMEHLVPLQKAGVIADMAASEIKRLGPTATVDQFREAMAKAVDSVDNRMGQLAYDNLVWNRLVKDIGLVTTRSLGWNLGTIREIGGGVSDVLGQTKKVVTGQLKGEPLITHRMGYIVALPVVVMFYGGIYQYLRTGDWPEELKDYFFPRTGGTNANGTPERVAFASYLKDIYAYGKHPGTTLSHKVHPLMSSIFDMLKNEDFYGVKIRNEGDPLVEQAKDTALYMVEQFLPFSIRNMQQRRENDEGIDRQLESFFGITPAPASVSQTKAEELANKLRAENIPREAKTREQAEMYKKLGKLRNKARKGEDILGELTDLVQDGTITPDQSRRALRDSRMTPLQANVKYLPIEDALRVFEEANVKEKADLRKVLLSLGRDGKSKVRRALEDATSDERLLLRAHMRRMGLLVSPSK